MEPEVKAQRSYLTLSPEENQNPAPPTESPEELSARMRGLARKRWDAPRDAKGNAGSGSQGEAGGKASEGMDALRKVMRDRGAPHSAVVSAARALLDQEAIAIPVVARTVEQLDLLSTQEQIALLHALAPHLPNPKDSAPIQG